MPLKPCRECRKRVSTEAQACPHCGAPSPVAPPRARGPDYRAQDKTQAKRMVLAVTVAVAVLSVMAVALDGPRWSRHASQRSTPPQGCVDVPRQLLDDIASTLTVDGGGSLREGRAHRSGAHQRAFFVAAEVVGPGLEETGNIGVWLVSGSLSSPGLLLAVDGTANAFSGLPNAGRTDAGSTMADPGAREARECVRNLRE